MQYNLRLLVVNKNDTTDTRYYNLVQLGSSVGFSGFKNDKKVVQGNRARGIEQGIGLQTAGRTISVAIPIFNHDELNVIDLVSEYTSVFSNCEAFYFYLEVKIDNEYYLCEVLFNECNGYQVKILNTFDGFGLKLIQKDNFFYSSSNVSDVIDYVGSQKKEIDYFNKSKISTPISFEWKIQGSGAFACYIFTKNYGLTFRHFINELGTHILKYDGVNAVMIENGVENLVDDVRGIQPILNIGNNKLIVNSNIDTVELKLIYKKGINL